MGAISKNQRFHRHFFNIVPRHTRRQSYLSLTILYEKRTDHREVGIRTYTTLIVGHCILPTEAAAGLAFAIRSLSLLEVVLHILGKVGEHLQQIILHIGFIDELGRDYAFGGAVVLCCCPHTCGEQSSQEKEFLHEVFCY